MASTGGRPSSSYAVIDTCGGEIEREEEEGKEGEEGEEGEI